MNQPLQSTLIPQLSRLLIDIAKSHTKDPEVHLSVTIGHGNGELTEFLRIAKHGETVIESTWTDDASRGGHVSVARGSHRVESPVNPATAESLEAATFTALTVLDAETDMG